MIEKLRERTHHYPPHVMVAMTVAPTGLLLLLFLLSPNAPKWLILLAFILLIIGQALMLILRPPESMIARANGEEDQEHAITLDELHELATRIHATADGVVLATQAINDVNEQQSGGANEQVEVIQMTTDMLDNFLHLSMRVNEQARVTTENAQQTASISEEGQTAIRDTISGMVRIRNQVLDIGKTIARLAQMTRRIDEIISSVSEIATQSNLLALNASIEAARAGTQGRGFAVVADEVRTLSQQSTSAADQVRSILAEIQSAVKETIEATEKGMEGLDNGLSQAEQADTIMLGLSNNVNDSHHSVRSIYDVIRQQTDGMEEIAINMERIKRITDNNLSSVQMVGTVSSNLTRLADELQMAVQLGQSVASSQNESEPEAQSE